MKKIMLLLAMLATTASYVSAEEQYTPFEPDTTPVHYIHNPVMDEIYYGDDSKPTIIYVNENVTTHIIMPENIKMVDISTSKIVGNQCSDNIVRIKPAGRMMKNELVGTITVIGERHLAQYNIVYSSGPDNANTIYNIQPSEMRRYDNPDVRMPQNVMARYSWAIVGSKRKYFGIHEHKDGIRAVVNNIYTIGDYFFLDFSLYNDTKIKYDIDEIRIKLTDKKETKSTNSQTIELQPVYTLNRCKSFKKGYRNVIVLDKLTFPDEKVLRIEISENQISGRVIYIPIEYEDILHADSFDESLMKQFEQPYYLHW